MVPAAWRERWRAVWLSASPVRTLGEALMVQLICLLWTLVIARQSPLLGLARAIPTLAVIAGPCCMLWSVFRLRRPTLRWWRRLGVYLAMGLVLALAPTAIFGVLWEDAARTGSVRFGAARFPIGPFLGAWLLVLTGAFLLSLLGARLLIFWNSLRRTRLVWALTHAHLLVVVVGALFLSGALVIADPILTGHAVITVLPALFFLFLLTVLVLLVVLPPSALFSYLFAHRTTRRLEALAAATSRLRDGDYSMRVPVQGADEVAQLQANFNAMAAELGRTVQELQAERDTVAMLLQARRELIASVSHELRTPVATLRGYLETSLAHWNGHPPTTLRRDLEVMEREAVRLQALMDDLFTLARADIGRLELCRAPVDLAALARRVVELLAPLAWQSQRVELTTSGDDAPPVLADAARVEQVLHNLLRNALHHTPPGGIVAVSVAAEAECVALRVEDTGEGMDPGELPRIWERFYRTERSRGRAGDGAGLGLALVKELIEGMGGNVAASSVPGEGSCFTVRLPRADRTAAVSGEPPAGER
jgi:signal transduction histidine kinase